jgi:hypothetical protein
MFESKINRGKVNGYAPLDGDGKVSLSHLPDVVGVAGTSGTSGVNGTSGTSVFADSNSLATTGSNTFTDNQIISGSGDSSLTIGEVNTIAGPSFGLRVSGSDGAPLFLTSDGTLLIGAITNPTNPSDDASFFANQLNSFPISDGPTAAILVQKSGSFQSNWVFDYDGKSYFPSDINIGYNSLGSGLTSGSLNITKGNINVSGSLLISGGIQFNDGSTQTTAWVADGISSTSTETVEVNDISTGNFENRGQITVSYTAYNGDAGLSFTADYQSPLTNQSGINVLAIKFSDETIQTTAFIPTTFVTTSSFNEYTSSIVTNSQTSSFVTNSQTSSFVTRTSVPTSLTGSEGDIDGMIAFDSGAIYFANETYYGAGPYTTTLYQSTASSPNFPITKGNFPKPKIGWTINVTDGFIVETITNVVEYTDYWLVYTNGGNSTVMAPSNVTLTTNGLLDNVWLKQEFISSSIINSLNSKTGSYATTGSNVFSGSQYISGSVNVNGSIYKDGNKQFNYGQWTSLETQTGSANTAYPMKLEVPIPEFEGIYVGNNASGFPTRIYAQNTGLYNIQFSAQLHTTSNESADFSVWFAMTGSNIVNSNTDFSIEKVSGGGFQVAALNFLTPIASGSYVELYWSKTTANGQLQYKGTQVSPTRPATPSVIVTVTQVA